ncbi:MAG TPA: BON domain-containing protein [Leifsonia sp.]|jgi:osmotically-inducible protein OsmY
MDDISSQTQALTEPPTEAARTFRDETVREAVESELAWTPGVHLPRVGVSVADGVVTLTGEMSSLQERLAAVKAALRVRGVRTVADQLEVPEDGREPEGSTLAAAVDSVLAWTSGVPHEGIHAEVEGHTVILTGTVEWDSERVAAKKAVERIQGVRSVDSRMEIRRRPSADDIEEEIRNAIVRNAILDSHHVHVVAEGSDVTLSGTVRSWVERQQAVRTAWSSPHVSAVHDLLEVDPGQLTDGRAASRPAH